MNEVEQPRDKINVAFLEAVYEGYLNGRGDPRELDAIAERNARLILQDRINTAYRLAEEGRKRIGEIPESRGLSPSAVPWGGRPSGYGRFYEGPVEAGSPDETGLIPQLERRKASIKVGTITKPGS